LKSGQLGICEIYDQQSDDLDASVEKLGTSPGMGILSDMGIDRKIILGNEWNAQIYPN
jgi:hypothetical protein